MDDPRILSRRKVRSRLEAAREEILAVSRVDLRKPVFDRGAGLLGDLELNRPACLLLNDNGAVSNSAAGSRPRAVRIPRALSSAAMPASEVVPVVQMSSITGNTSSACRSASAKMAAMAAT
jgi:hypothetical protein